MTILGNVLEAERAQMQLAHLRMICQGLLFRLAQQQQSREGKNRGFVVVLTSAAQGAGVSRITHALTDALNRAGGQCAIALDCRNMDCDRYGFVDPIDLNEGRNSDNSWNVPRVAVDSWHGIRESLASILDRFRQQYQYILIDCPSLRETQDAVRLAPLADGTILVVEANRTQKEQLLYAEKTIESAKGTIMGYVLNKRTYVIPNWLSRRMEAVGV
jgi:Mrp family chromosome partitioning ATPase